METLLFISFCSLIIFNPALANLAPGPAPAPAPSGSPSSSLSSIFPIFPSLHEAIPVNNAKVGLQVSSNKANPALTNICKTTDDVDFCVSTISPLLHGKYDTLSVLEQAIKVAINNAKTAVDVATKIATIPTTPATMKSIACDCKDSYNDALDNYQQALDALAKKDVGTMNSMLSAAITDSSDCDDRLSGYKSPLVDFDSKMKLMTSNCLAIVTLVK